MLFEIPQQENPEINKKELERALQKYQDQWDVWGHGVETLETAEKIKIEGLRTGWNALQDIAYKIPDNPDSRLHKFEGWDYAARRIIVLIAAPKGIIFSDVDIDGQNKRDESIENSAKYIFSPPQGPKNIIPSSNIIGYVDVNTYRLIVNPNFSQDT